MIALIVLLLDLYLLVIIARSVFSFFQVREGTFVAKVYDVIYAITEPVLAPVRSVIGPVDFGGMGIDLSPMVVMLAIIIITRILG